MGQNHIIDPLFFYDLIEQFAFDYEWYAMSDTFVDDMGRQTACYTKQTIRGSLQTHGVTLSQNLSAVSTQSKTYQFYCMSLYRIQIGDFIHYNNQWLYTTDVKDYDEGGVRLATLHMVDLANHKDFKEYLLYLNGGMQV